MTIFRNRVVKFIILVISLGLCVSATGTIVDLWHRRDLVVERQQDLTRIQDENRGLTQQLHESQGEGYVEKIARDKLGMVKDGEAIVLLPQAQGNAPGGVINDDNRPNWQKWWKLFF